MKTTLYHLCIAYKFVNSTRFSIVGCFHLNSWFKGNTPAIFQTYGNSFLFDCNIFV